MTFFGTPPILYWFQTAEASGASLMARNHYWPRITVAITTAPLAVGHRSLCFYSIGPKPLEPPELLLLPQTTGISNSSLFAPTLSSLHRFPTGLKSLWCPLLLHRQLLPDRRGGRPESSLSPLTRRGDPPPPGPGEGGVITPYSRSIAVLL